MRIGLIEKPLRLLSRRALASSVFLFVVLLTLVLSNAWQIQALQKARQHDEALLLARQTKELFQREIEKDLFLLQVVADFWGEGLVHDKAPFLFRRFFNRYPWVGYLSFLDGEGKVLWSMSPKAEEIEGLDISADPQRKALLTLAKKENTVVLSPPIMLYSLGEIGLVAYAPIYRQGEFLGFLSIGMPFVEIAKTIFPAGLLEQYHVHLADSDSPMALIQDEKAQTIDLNFTVLNRHYYLALSPKIPLGSALLARFSAIGLLFSMFMAVLFYSLLHRHRQLSESEARFRDLADLLPDAVLECSPAFQITYANQVAKQFLPQGRAAGLIKLSDLVSPEDWEALAHRFEQMLNDGEPIYEFTINLESAQNRIVELSANAIFNEKNHKGYRMVLRDITEKLQTEEQLYRMANYDALTGLPNRSFFYDYLRHVIARAERERTRFAILFSDLDRFKYINDSLGHHVGDLLLEEAAKRMASAVRRADTVARLGGDEFTIIIEDIKDAADAARVAQKIIDVLTQPFEIEGKTLAAGTSVGIALYPDDGANIEELVRKADTAMYEAKRVGGNCYHFYAQEINQKIDRYVDLEAGLREALQKKQFVLYYQPLWDPQGMELIALEALIRWQKPGAGLVMPGQFIPFAEESGLIVTIGEWVLNEALGQMKRWQEQGINNIYVAINLSARQLDQGLIVEQLQEALNRTGVEPKNVVMEITESTLMHTENGEQVLHDLKASGVRIALDDFGTGYSSLAYLSNLPIDIVKIDRSFIIPIPDAIRNAMIVRAVIDLAKSLQLQVVAEGVETEGQRRFLQTEGQVLLQGYLFSPPLPVHEVERLLRQKDACADGGA